MDFFCTYLTFSPKYMTKDSVVRASRRLPTIETIVTASSMILELFRVSETMLITFFIDNPETYVETIKG